MITGSKRALAVWSKCTCPAGPKGPCPGLCIGTYATGRWVFGGQLGVLKTEENQDGYSETGGRTARPVTERRISLSQGVISI